MKLSILSGFKFTLIQDNRQVLGFDYLRDGQRRGQARHRIVKLARCERFCADLKISEYLVRACEKTSRTLSSKGHHTAATATSNLQLNAQNNYVLSAVFAIVKTSRGSTLCCTTSIYEHVNGPACVT